MNPVMNPLTSDDANTYSYKTPPSSPKVPHVLDPKVLSKNYTYSFSRVSASFNGTFFFRSLIIDSLLSLLCKYFSILIDYE